jgi:agmatinase
MTTQLASNGTALILSPWMSVEQLDETTATIYLSSDGTRIRIPLPLHRLLLRFTAATDPGDVCGANDLQGPAARAIAQLKNKGFLVSAHSVPVVRSRPVSDPPVRLFDAPAQKLVPAEVDLVVLGMPWDFSDRDAVGARRGPLAIREVSLHMLYRLDRHTGRPLGWYDADRRRPLLAGISIADAGDVIVNHGERRSSVFDRARNVLETLTRDGALPILLGGDTSIAYPVIDQLQRGGLLDVIRIGRPSPGQTRDASLAAQVLAMSFVGQFIHIVPRGVGGDSAEAPDGYAQVSIDDALAMNIGPISRGLKEGRRVHVSIDVDALANASDCPSHPSFAYRDIHALLCRIGRIYRIASIGLCGINPSGTCWGARSMTALHLLLIALSAAMDPA